MGEVDLTYFPENPYDDEDSYPYTLVEPVISYIPDITPRERLRLQHKKLTFYHQLWKNHETLKEKKLRRRIYTH